MWCYAQGGNLLAQEDHEEFIGKWRAQSCQTRVKGVVSAFRGGDRSCKVCFLSGRQIGSTTTGSRSAPSKPSAMLVSAFAISSSDATDSWSSRIANATQVASSRHRLYAIRGPAVQWHPSVPPPPVPLLCARLRLTGVRGGKAPQRSGDIGPAW